MAEFPKDVMGDPKSAAACMMSAEEPERSPRGEWGPQRRLEERLDNIDRWLKKRRRRWSFAR
jgi:hypothetical protein